MPSRSDLLAISVGSLTAGVGVTVVAATTAVLWGLVAYFLSKTVQSTLRAVGTD